MLEVEEILLNMIIVSVPEELLITLIALLLMGRYDFIDRYNIKSSLKKIMIIVVIPCSIIFSYFLYGVHLNFYMRMLSNYIVFYVAMIILLRSREWIKVAIVSILTMFLLVLIELTTTLALIHIFNFNIAILNTSPWINFILLLPVRIIQFSIVYLIYLKKNTIVTVSILSIWGENLLYRKLIFICIGVDMIISSFIYNEFTLQRNVEILPLETQMIIVIALFILLILNIVTPWAAVLITYPSGIYKNKQTD